MSTTNTKTVSLTEWCKQHDMDVPPVECGDPSSPQGYKTTVEKWFGGATLLVTAEPIYHETDGTGDGTVIIWGMICMDIDAPDDEFNRHIIVLKESGVEIIAQIEEYGVALEAECPNGSAYYASTTDELEAIKAFVPMPPLS